MATLPELIARAELHAIDALRHLHILDILPADDPRSVVRAEAAERAFYDGARVTTAIGESLRDGRPPAKLEATKEKSSG